MSAEKLQSAIREKKTPVALGLAPEIEKISPKILKNFEENNTNLQVTIGKIGKIVYDYR